MRLLPVHTITDVYCIIDDLITEPAKLKRGCPPTLRYSEIITMLIWNVLVIRQQTLKDVYRVICQYHTTDFPHIPPYNRFIDHCHRAIPLMVLLVRNTLCTKRRLSLLIPPCSKYVNWFVQTDIRFVQKLRLLVRITKDGIMDLSYTQVLFLTDVSARWHSRPPICMTPNCCHLW